MCGVVSSNGLITGEQAFESGMITPEQLGHFAHWGTVRAFGVNRKLYTDRHDWELIRWRQGAPLRDRISFHFDFEEYKAHKHIDYDAIAAEQYRKDLSEMMFLTGEIEAALFNLEASKRHEQELERMRAAQNNTEAERDNSQANIDPEPIKRGPGRPRKEVH